MAATVNLNKLVTYNPQADYQQNEQMALLWKGAAAISSAAIVLIFTSSVLTFAIGAVIAYYPGKYFWDQAAPYDKAADFAHRVVKKTEELKQQGPVTQDLMVALYRARQTDVYYGFEAETFTTLLARIQVLAELSTEHAQTPNLKIQAAYEKLQLAECIYLLGHPMTLDSLVNRCTCISDKESFKVTNQKGSSLELDQVLNTSASDLVNFLL